MFPVASLKVIPMVVNMKDANLGRYLLAYVSTIAGNLTLIGSVANLIVVERAKDYYKVCREFFISKHISCFRVPACSIYRSAFGNI